MQLRYHYSIIAGFIFLCLGCALLVFGFDILVLHKLVSKAGAPPTFVAVIALSLGGMMASGFFANLIRGKDYVLEADSEGITIHTRSINGKSPKIHVAWSDVLKLEEKSMGSALRTNRNDHLTKMIVITVRPDVIEWPSVMIAKNRIQFHPGKDHDELIIDAWLNKKKSVIVEEIKAIATGVNPDIQ